MGRLGKTKLQQDVETAVCARNLPKPRSRAIPVLVVVAIVATTAAIAEKQFGTLTKLSYLLVDWIPPNVNSDGTVDYTIRRRDSLYHLDWVLRLPRRFDVRISAGKVGQIRFNGFPAVRPNSYASFLVYFDDASPAPPEFYDIKDREKLVEMRKKTASVRLGSLPTSKREVREKLEELKQSGCQIGREIHNGIYEFLDPNNPDNENCPIAGGSRRFIYAYSDAQAIVRCGKMCYFDVVVLTNMRMNIYFHKSLSSGLADLHAKLDQLIVAATVSLELSCPDFAGVRIPRVGCPAK